MISRIKIISKGLTFRTDLPVPNRSERTGELADLVNTLAQMTVGGPSLMIDADHPAASKYPNSRSTKAQTRAHQYGKSVNRSFSTTRNYNGSVTIWRTA